MKEEARVRGKERGEMRKEKVGKERTRVRGKGKESLIPHSDNSYVRL